MKKIVLFIGVTISFWLASCSANANDVDLIKTEELSEKSNTLISPAQAKNATINFFLQQQKNQIVWNTKC